MTTARGRRRLLAIGAALAAWAAYATPAVGGTYTAWSCRDGANVPTEGLADWSYATSGKGGYLYSFAAPCQTLYTSEGETSNPFGTMVLADVANNPSLVTEDMSVAAGRPDLTLTGARVWWRGHVSGSGQVAAIATQPDGSQRTVADRRASFPASGAPGTDPAPTDTVDLGGAIGLTLRAACLGNCQDVTAPDQDGIASYQAYRVALTVRDVQEPSGQASGELLSVPVLRGQQSIAVDATDRGGGVYRAQILVDGQVRALAYIGDARCRDVEDANGDPLEFATVRPCPLHGAAQVTLDTTSLGEDAYHDLRVQIVDAAGNTVDLAHRVVGVDNRGHAPGFFDRVARRFENPFFDLASPRRLNGAGATAAARLRVYLPVRHGRKSRAKRRRTVRYTSRATLRGVLTDVHGNAIVGAAVWTATRIVGGEWQIGGRPHTTGKTGRIGFRLPAKTPSRGISLVYFPFSDSHEQVVASPVTLNVHAGVTFSVSRRHVRNGHRVRFTGRVAGLTPGRGVAAALQAKVGHRYRTFRQLRLTPRSRGRFRTVYRFSATRRPTRYRFRLLVMKQAGLPFERTASAVRTVLVTP